jgi:hypothetical protein
MWLAKKKPRHILFSGIEGVIEGRSEWIKRKSTPSSTSLPSDKSAQPLQSQSQQQSNLSNKNGTNDTTVLSPSEEGEEDNDFVEGPLRWLKDNPGRQLLTGSFHPIGKYHINRFYFEQRD